MQGTKSGNKKIVSLTLTMYRNYISQIWCYESGLSKGVEPKKLMHAFGL